MTFVGEDSHHQRVLYPTIKELFTVLEWRWSEYVTLQKYFSHSSLVIYCFGTLLTYLLKQGEHIGRELLIANHLDQS